MTYRHEQTFRPDVRYSVYFTEDVFGSDQNLFAQLARRRRLLFVVDAGVVRRHPRLLIEIARYSETHSLEYDAQASLLLDHDTLKHDGHAPWTLYHALHAHRASPTLVVAIGGRTLLGCAGWAAANAGRFARLLRIPTTAIAQCDAGLGLCNTATVFGDPACVVHAAPHAVINDSAFLRSASHDSWSAGCLRVLEIALLHDRALFEFIECAAPHLRDHDTACLRAAIQRCAGLRLRAIAEDPYEQTQADVDIGEWANEITECATGHRLRRNEGRAYGLAFVATYAHAAGLLTETDWRRTLATIAGLGFPALPTLRGRRTWRSPALALTDVALPVLTVPVGIGCQRRLTMDAATWMRTCEILMKAQTPEDRTVVQGIPARAVRRRRAAV